MQAAHNGLALMLGESFASVGFARPVELTGVAPFEGFDALLALSGRQPGLSAVRGRHG